MQNYDARDAVWAAAVIDVSGQAAFAGSINDMVLINLEEIATQVSCCILPLPHVCYGPPYDFAQIFADKLPCCQRLCGVLKAPS